MKGKIILTDIEEHRGGAQVLCPITGGWHISTIKHIDNNGNYWLVGGNEWFDFTFEPSELKQIAVEYEEEGPIHEWVDKVTLPLHPDDWQTAIAVIGHECEFYRQECEEYFDEGFPSLGIPSSTKREVYAKLYPKVLPTPVRTIEDIPEELRKNYKLRPFSVIIDDGFCVHKYELIGNDNYSINDVINSIAEKLKVGIKHVVQGEDRDIPVEETWDDIIENYEQYCKNYWNSDRSFTEDGKLLSLSGWLKQYYNIPKRK